MYQCMVHGVCQSEDKEVEGGGGGKREMVLTVLLLARLWVEPSETAAVGLGSVVHAPCGVSTRARECGTLTGAGAVEPLDRVLLLRGALQVKLGGAHDHIANAPHKVWIDSRVARECEEVDTTHIQGVLTAALLASSTPVAE